MESNIQEKKISGKKYTSRNHKKIETKIKQTCLKVTVGYRMFLKPY